jgi:hypothetical protein
VSYANKIAASRAIPLAEARREAAEKQLLSEGLRTPIHYLRTAYAVTSPLRTFCCMWKPRSDGLHGFALHRRIGERVSRSTRRGLSTRSWPLHQITAHLAQGEVQMGVAVVYSHGEVGVEDRPDPKILAPNDAILRFVRDLHLRVGPGTLLRYRADRSSAADGPARPPPESRTV